MKIKKMMDSFEEKEIKKIAIKDSEINSKEMKR